MKQKIHLVFYKFCPHGPNQAKDRNNSTLVIP